MYKRGNKRLQIFLAKYKHTVCVDGGMDGWMDGWREGGVDGWVDGGRDGGRDGWVGGQAEPLAGAQLTTSQRSQAVCC